MLKRNNGIEPEKLDGKVIAVIDDHALFLDGLAGLIQNMGEGIDLHCFGSGLDFLKAMDEGTDFDLVLTDLTMKAMNGLAVADAVRARPNAAPVLVVSGIDEAIVQQDVMLSGASGFVHKSAGAETLKAAMLDALAHAPGLSDDANGVHQKTPTPTADLSARQLEILHLLDDGYTNRTISERLFISENTVKSHMKLIFKALGVNRRTAVLRKAKALGFI